MKRASQQFGESEVALLADILDGIARERIDPDWARDKRFALIARKVATMKATVKTTITCDDCGEETQSGGRGVRRTCKLCKKKLCGYCYHHFHARHVSASTG